MIVTGMVSRRDFVAGASLGLAALGSGETMENDKSGRITDVGGLRVGHFTDTRRPTGCTVVLFDHGAVAGVDVRGSAPGTRETDLLDPINTVQQVNAILLTGGSAFGLDAATGVMRYLESHGMGFHTAAGAVPIVPAAVLYDLNIGGDPKIRPDAEAGFKACENASSADVPEGNVGAGAGATVGKIFGFRYAMKGGLGTASVRVGNSDLIVGAIVAVNPAGDVLDYKTGKIIAGARTPDGRGFRDAMAQIIAGATIQPRAGVNSAIGIVATNAKLTKPEATKIAQMAHDGFARSINPVHTMFDGDTIFAAGTGTSTTTADLTTVGAVAAEVMAQAVDRAILTATGIPGYPAHRDVATER
ncbi:MAG TPA: P1 family peptidase [Bryobacteraceae bacterium]|jgi:L-aminopeptidase/D-esterase-like protein|nr:P1 family peptidase [Bryobacteraceae bacterium]